MKLGRLIEIPYDNPLVIRVSKPKSPGIYYAQGAKILQSLTHVKTS